MAIGSSKHATIDDLYRVEGKAELIGGRIVHLMPSGFTPGQVAFEIAVSLRDHARQTGLGIAFADGTGFTVPELPSGRESFCPDAAYYDGLPLRNMRFHAGPPTFAVEVRSENDYGPKAEHKMAAKRADYFAAGTLVVWDVDPIAETVARYQADKPDQPTVFTRDDTADAEPAVPGWRVELGAVFG